MVVPMEAQTSLRMSAAKEGSAMAGGRRSHRSERNPMASFGERLRQSFSVAEETQADTIGRMAEAIDARRERARRRSAGTAAPGPSPGKPSRPKD